LLLPPPLWLLSAMALASLVLVLLVLVPSMEPVLLATVLLVLLAFTRGRLRKVMYLFALNDLLPE
jgi:hypothetical protein